MAILNTKYSKEYAEGQSLQAAHPCFEKTKCIMKKLLFFLVLGTFLGCGGSDDNSPQPTDTFDRKAMLTNWSENIIQPGLAANVARLTALEAAASTFNDTPDLQQLEAVQIAFADAYREWQRIAMFEIGKAEELALINRMNLYPTDVAGIEANITDGGYNLELPSQRTRQGLPAVDYLLFGLGEDNATILSVYTDADNGAAYRSYLLDLCTEMKSLLEAVQADWAGGYDATFVENDGNSATASTDRLVNDFIFYYEKHLRAGKIGIPAGVFSGGELPNNVEALYAKNLARELALISLSAAQDFFLGLSYTDRTANGPGLSTYLDELEVMKDNSLLSAVITDQFELARTEIEELSENLAEQVNTNNIAMLEAYDALQINVVNLKVDMLQSLNINVDYVDADGD